MLTQLASALRNRTCALVRNTAFRAMSGRPRFKPEEALLICADPRGGSTWLAEVLSRVQGVAMFLEPLNIGETKMFQDLGFGHRHFVAENADVPIVRDRFSSLFSGKLLDPYVLHETSLRDLYKADKALIKFCRATQMLPWFTTQFQFVRKPVHLLRHPCAVIASQMRFGSWDKVPTKFSESAIMADPLLAPHFDTLIRIDSVEARLAAYWAAANSVALNHPDRKSRWITVHYEALLHDPNATISHILEDWSLKLDGTIEQFTSRPSKTTLGSSPIKSGNKRDQLTYWKKSLTPEQVNRVIDTIEAMGVSVYSDDPMPRL